MPELGERLWPEESEQPFYALSVDGNTYYLDWENTRLQFYRTGIEEYDEALQEYDHVAHQFIDQTNGKTRAWIFSFDVVGYECVEYLIDNNYPRSTKPTVDGYLLKHIANAEAQDIPESIGPDFGTTP